MADLSKMEIDLYCPNCEKTWQEPIPIPLGIMELGQRCSICIHCWKPGVKLTFTESTITPTPIMKLWDEDLRGLAHRLSDVIDAMNIFSTDGGIFPGKWVDDILSVAIDIINQADRLIGDESLSSLQPDDFLSDIPIEPGDIESAVQAVETIGEMIAAIEESRESRDYSQLNPKKKRRKRNLGNQAVLDGDPVKTPITRASSIHRRAVKLNPDQQTALIKDYLTKFLSGDRKGQWKYTNKQLEIRHNTTSGGMQRILQEHGIKPQRCPRQKQLQLVEKG